MSMSCQRVGGCVGVRACVAFRWRLFLPPGVETGSRRVAGKKERIVMGCAYQTDVFFLSRGVCSRKRDPTHVFQAVIGGLGDCFSQIEARGKRKDGQPAFFFPCVRVMAYVDFAISFAVSFPQVMLLQAERCLEQDFLLNRHE